MDFSMGSLLLVLYKACETLLALLPYILAGIILGELLKLTSWTKIIYRWTTTSSPFLAVLAAVVLGAASPICTFGTVPVVLLLLRAGVGISPLVAFLSVSSMMNPQLFILTYGGLGKEIAVIRLFSVLVFGLAIGLAAYYVPTYSILKSGIVIGNKGRDNISSNSFKKFSLKKFAKDVLDNLEYIGFYIIIGVILGALIEVYAQGHLTYMLSGSGKRLSVPIAALLGVPLYSCGGGTIPVIQAFIREGMSKGAAIAFLITGPATRITPLMALAAILRPIAIILYVVVLIAFSLCIGLIYY